MFMLEFLSKQALKINVAGVMKHRMFHQSFACGEEKPWLFIGADMTPPPLSSCEQILEELRAVNAPLPPT